MNDYLLYYSWLCNGDNYKIFLSIKNHVPVDTKRLQMMMEELENKQIKFITVMDDEYPKELLNYKYPPFVLFYKGNKKLLLNEERIFVTGELDTNNKEISFEYFNNNKDVLADNITLVTNDYKNMDQYIIHYFKQKNKPIIKVFANGFDFENSHVNLQKELWISQYPPNTHPKKIRFKERNLISSALSKELIIFSSKEKSKIMNLANCFANLGKDVNCFPGINLEDGNNELIKNGAKMITKISDVILY